jgi:hypothetical protein
MSGRRAGSPSAPVHAPGRDRLATTAICLNFTNIHIQDEFERKW